MARILLVKPPFARLLQNSVYFSYPLGLMYVAGMLKQRGHEVRIYHDDVSNPEPLPVNEVLIDQPAIPEPTPEMCAPFEAALDDFDPQIVGFGYCTTDAPSAHCFARIAKERGLRTVAGGPHPSVLPEEEAATGLFDVVVVGEGDHPEAAWAFSGPCANIVRVPPVEDLNAVLPDRHCVIGGEAFTSWWRGMVETQRGCPNRCGFCAAPLMFGKRMRFRNPALVREELETLDTDGGFLIDDCLTADREHLLQVCEEFGKLDFIWWCHAAFQDVDEALLEKMRDGGCIRPGFGYESASERWRRLCGKRVEPAHAERMVVAAVALGMQIVTYFIIGFPGETIEELDATLDCAAYMKELGAAPCISIATPYPKTRLSQMVDTESLKWTDFMHQSRRRGFADCTDEEWADVIERMHEINKEPVRNG